MPKHGRIAKYAITALISLLLMALTGCLGQEETVLVGEDGSAMVKLEVSGDPEDFGDDFALAPGVAWNETEDTTQKNVNGSSERDVTVALHIPAGRDFPTQYVQFDTKYPDNNLGFDTKITVKRDGSRRIYRFERTYHARRYVVFNYDAQGDVDSSLEQEVLDKGIFNVSKEDRDKYIAHLVYVFSYAEAALFAEASGSLVLSGSLSSEGKAVADSAAEDFLQRNVKPSRLLEILAAPDDSISVLYDREKESVTSALEGLLVGVCKRFGLSDPRVTKEAMANIESEIKVTDRLNSQTYSVKVKMPGTIVSTNGLQDEFGSDEVNWEFKGDKLHDQDLPLWVVSVLEDKK